MPHPHFLTASTAHFKTRLDSPSDTLTYVGKAQAGAATSDPAWQIFAINTASGVAVDFADGTVDFDKVWDNRASYTY